jgi:hypothetical protein
MKLKYRKVFLLVLLSTMGMGILTLSYSPDSNNKNGDAAEVMSDGSQSTDNSYEAARTADTPTALPTLIPLPTVTPVPTPIPTPTPLPVYPLEDEGYPKIEALIKNYYDAKISCDTDLFKTILSDPSDIPTTEQLKADVMYIEKYQAINCFVKKSFEDDCYIVYVYYEIKFLNIDTRAPALDKFYIVTDSSSDLKIFSGKLSDEIKEYYDDRLMDDDVQSLIKATDEKGEKAKSKA